MSRDDPGRAGGGPLDGPWEAVGAATPGAHHVAGHHWGLWRLGLPFGPVGLSVSLPPLDREVAADAEATGLLAEVLSIEYEDGLWRLADFGLGIGDVDWKRVEGRMPDVLVASMGRGCRRQVQRALRLLADKTWLNEAAWHLLREWDEVRALATVLGRGQVLERDEVAGVLRWW